MKTLRRFRRPSSGINPGFQIAPMIDVVFVILLFFIVASGNARQESALNTVLPSLCTIGMTFVDPVEVRIDEAGQVYLNEEPLDSPEVRALPGFTQAIREIRRAGYDTEKGSELNLSTHERTKYQRVVDVLDVLAKEKITNVTFQEGGEE
jgi:biopolymer transport protein ExbD